MLKFKHCSEDRLIWAERHIAVKGKAVWMTSKPKKSDGHMFSIELKSKEAMKNLTLENKDGHNVLIEGFLGELASLYFTEGIMLEINGSCGSLRMDLSEKELKSLIPKKKSIHEKKRSKNEKNQEL